MDKKDRRSSILRTIDENQPGNTNRIPRRVSFHNFRIVKEFDSALEAIDRTPQQEPMQLSTDASSLGLSAETAENVALPENVFAMNETFTESKDTTTNSKTNETAFILNKLDGDFVAFENDETLVSEATIAVFEQLGAGTSACPSETVSPELLNDANVVVESSMPVENSSLTFVPGTPATGKCAVTKRAEELLASLEIPKKEIPLTERYPHLAEAARADKEWRNCQRTTSTLINRKPFVEPSFVSFSDDVNGTEAHLSFSNASINSIGIQKQGNGFTHVFSSYGCCTRNLNSAETALMNTLSEQVDQLKAFGTNLTEKQVEITELIEKIQPELLVYEFRQVPYIIRCLSEISLIDLFFEGSNGKPIDPKLIGVLNCIMNKSAEVQKTASQLFDEMQVEFPKSKFIAKVTYAIFADRLTNPAKKENYYKSTCEIIERSEKVAMIRAQRMKEFNQEVERRKSIREAEMKKSDEEFTKVMATVMANLRSIAVNFIVFS